MNIIFINGWACDQQLLQPLCSALQQNSGQTQVLTLPELRQHADDYATALLSLLPTTAPVLLVGWSTGAIIALDALRRRRRETAAVVGLVAISATARFCNDQPDYSCGIAAARLRALRKALRRQAQQSLSQFFTDVYAPAEADAAMHAAAVAAALNMGDAELQHGLQYLETTDMRAELSELSCPVLLLHGTDDQIIPAAAAEFLQNQLPTATLQLFAGHGHALPTTAPTLIHDLIEHWLRQTG